MRIVQTSTTVNVSGYMDRLEHGIVRKHYEVLFQHVKEPVFVQRPQIDDFNSMVVVHDQVEQYV